MSQRKKSNRDFPLAAISIGIFSALLSFSFYIWSPAILRTIDLKFSDFRFKIRGEVTPNPQVAIVAIDEKSVNQLGRWPWSRYRLAEIMGKLKDYDPKVIAFDITFSENESEDADRALSEALEKCRNPILGYFFRNDSTEEPPPQSVKQTKRSSIKLIKFLGEPKHNFLKEFKSADLNVPEIGAHAKGFGFFNAVPDEDGTVRRAQLLIKYKEEIYPSLNMVGMKQFIGGEILLTLASYGVEGLYLKQTQIPVDERGQFMINYYGRGGTFPTFSVVDVLSGKVPAEALKDKLVLFGATETGIADVKPTPFDPIFPGVEIHATVAGNILDGRFLIKNKLTTLIDIALLSILPIMLVLLLMRVQKTFIGFAVFSAFVLLHLLGNYLIFTRLNMLLSALYPALSLGLVYTLFEGYRNLVIERRNRYLRKAFSSYVSPELVAEILQDPDTLKLGGETKNISVLFSDIRGFTTLSEILHPETLVAILNEYLNPMTQIVMNERGTLDKYIGDAIMAIFGAPLDVSDHSERACKAALFMLENLDKLNLEWEKRDWPHISVGIGINTGEAIVGNMGTDMRFEYTAIGDTVNLASRLEGLNKLYGSEIIISKSTLDNVDSSQFFVRELDLAQVKGKEQPIAIFELLGFRTADPEKAVLIDGFTDALHSYRAQKFHEAWKKFAELLKLFPLDKPSILYL
ncbi:MAG: CHASE2 domain-containing protein, partial [Thermodesulfobacteriota bacterium]